MDPLTLQFINGDGDLSIPPVREVRWSEESELNIDLVLEEVRKRPQKIQNDAQAETYKEKMNKIRDAERAIKKAVNETKEPLVVILSMIEDSKKPKLQELASEGTAILNEITRWESGKRIGLSQIRVKAEEEITAAQQKLATIKNPKEKAAIKRKINTLKIESGLAVGKAEKPTSHGVAIIKKWEGKMVNPALFFKSQYADKGFFDIQPNQHKINEFCKDIIRNGGMIRSSTMPGVELNETTFGRWNG